MSTTRLDEATALFEEIRASFASLQMHLDASDPHVDVSVEIPSQDRLQFRVSMNLQNGDELHLTVDESFWCSWFPSSDPRVREDYKGAVVGVLSGANRILEHRRWGRVVKAELQAPQNEGWRTIASSGGGLLPLSWFSKTQVLRNQPAAHGGP